MYSTSVKDLYAVIRRRGGLTNTLRMETLVADLYINQGWPITEKTLHAEAAPTIPAKAA